MKNTKFYLPVAAALLLAPVSSRSQSTIVAQSGVPLILSGTAAKGTGTVTYEWFRGTVALPYCSGVAAQNCTIPAANTQWGLGKEVQFKRQVKIVDACQGGAVASSNTLSVTFCDLIVNGVCWARMNVSLNGSFSFDPDEYTSFFQWNRYKDWDATGSIGSWGTSSITDPAWNDPNGRPCPDGWRLPTQGELQALHDVSVPVGGTWVDAGKKGNANPGRFYGPSSANCSLATGGSMVECVFLPAGGYRGNVNGSLSFQGTNGYYWSSTQSSNTHGYSLYFNNANSNATNDANKASGLNVRCVR